ncbi:hypothetical protein CCYA_CCYA07G2003 [Cyanidiococcus yangmingshanensis]|nr:hypothetical protein CCYA_CCYA07G2003 [Cyanidiococcus yangmingshanensis]
MSFRDALQYAKRWGNSHGESWRMVECPFCHGTGEIECPNCDGQGRRLSLLVFLNVTTPCLLCLGKPTVVCGNCEGVGRFLMTEDGRRLRQPPKYRSDIPPGVAKWNVFANTRIPTANVPPEIAAVTIGVKYDVFGQEIPQTPEERLLEWKRAGKLDKPVRLPGF